MGVGDNFSYSKKANPIKLGSFISPLLILRRSSTVTTGQGAVQRDSEGKWLRTIRLAA